MSAPSSSSSPFPQFQPRATDDTVFYAVYPDASPDSSSDAELLISLQLRIIHLLARFTDGYIWQHEPFLLSLPSSSPSKICHLCGSPDAPHLHGKTRFGDNLEDEWFIVFLLFLVSRLFSGELSIRVWDSDGEFLLIEAAFALPRWISPESSPNRVAIRDGFLHIVPRSVFPSTPSLRDALDAISSPDVSTRASDAVQSAIARRISGYPERAFSNMHRIRVRVPLPVAQVLKHEPCLISLAVECFYDRDVDSMKHAARMERFLSVAEMVKVSVRMSRVMYAQLLHQRFQEPRCYPSPPGKEEGPEAFAEWELGMKIACGFEMMYQERRGGVDHGKGSAREAFVMSLESSGYFQGQLQGSKSYQRLMETAEEYFKSTSLFTRTRDSLNAPVQLIDEILSLPYSIDDFSGIQIPPNDDDSWLYNGEDELSSIISERQIEMENHEQKHKLSSKDMQQETFSNNCNPYKDGSVLGNIAQSMQAFVQKNSSFEGAEIPIIRDSGTVQLDVNQFMRDLESVIGTLEEEGNCDDLDIDEGCASSCSEDFDDSDDETDAFEPLEGNEGRSRFMQAYSDALNKELNESTLQRSFVRAHEQSNNNDQGTSSTDVEDDLTPVDVDVNLVKSFLDSYSSQQGLPGPASNILGLMGLKMPPEAKH